MNIHQYAKEKVTEYLQKSGMAASYFGLKAVKDTAFMRRLAIGSAGIGKVQQALQYIKDNKGKRNGKR